MQAIHYPDYTGSNPYQTLMFDSLRKAGVPVSAFNGTTREFARITRASSAQILHLHWVSGHIITGRLLRTLAGAVLFWWALIAWRLRGRKIVWTLHNLKSHERRRVWLDTINARVIARLADRVLVHGASVVDLAARSLKVSPRKIAVIHHGNYDGIIEPRPIDAAHAGRRFLFCGRIETYKGVPGLIRAFSELDGPHALTIAGRVTDAALQREIADLAGRDPRVACRFGFLSNAELDGLLAWSDVAALPYLDIFTSGSLLLILTAARPVVAPNLGLIAEYADGRGAFLYDPADPAALAGALRAAAAAPDLAERAGLARARAEAFGWDRIGADLAALYRSL